MKKGGKYIKYSFKNLSKICVRLRYRALGILATAKMAFDNVRADDPEPAFSEPGSEYIFEQKQTTFMNEDVFVYSWFPLGNGNGNGNSAEKKFLHQWSDHQGLIAPLP